MNHASWLDAWDRGLVVPASAAMQWKGRSLNRMPPVASFFFQRQKSVLSKESCGFVEQEKSLDFLLS